MFSSVQFSSVVIATYDARGYLVWHTIPLDFIGHYFLCSIIIQSSVSTLLGIIFFLRSLYSKFSSVYRFSLHWWGMVWWWGMGDHTIQVQSTLVGGWQIIPLVGGWEIIPYQTRPLAPKHPIDCTANHTQASLYGMVYLATSTTAAYAPATTQGPKQASRASTGPKHQQNINWNLFHTK